jgi:hypothetical protein
METVWVYTDMSKQIGDPHQLLVFADQESATTRNEWRLNTHRLGDRSVNRRKLLGCLVG